MRQQATIQMDAITTTRAAYVLYRFVCRRCGGRCAMRAGAEPPSTDEPVTCRHDWAPVLETRDGP